jgi:aspartyl-tRNA(Asn)/glutamyl-tRNA(Gln) amidotransferase subunit C
MITKTDIEKLAKLSRLTLTETEKEKYLKDMESILVYVGQINAAQIKDMKPKAGNPRNVMRDDDHPHESGIFTDELLKLAPKSENGRVKVKKIL